MVAKSPEATALGAQALLLFTDVDAVYDQWGTEGARRIEASTPAGLRAREAEAGSMAPKVEAGARFVERGGPPSAIGALEDASALLAGRAGAQVRTGSSPWD